MSWKNGESEASPERVCVVTVTYGNRCQFVEKLVKAVIEEGAGRVIVVDNASCPATQEKTRALATALGERIQVVQLQENVGSAAGFKAGLQRAATCTSCEFIWLLDDDNVPKPGALERLCLAYRLLGSDPQNTLLSLRRNLWWYVRAATQGTRVDIARNSFLGFHVRELPGKLRQRFIKTKRLQGIPRFPLVSVDLAPYGGFFFHKSWLDRVGMPDERFFVYQDDIEFSTRFVREGGRIFLCAASEVEDIEQSWFLRPSGAHPLLAPSVEERRIYYACRNRIWVERRYVASNAVYQVNRWVYVSLLVVWGLVVNRRPLDLIRRLCLLRRAWQDAEANRLGRVERCKNP